LPEVLLSTVFGKGGSHDPWSKELFRRKPRNAYG
jgi:hypothetical protein